MVDVDNNKQDWVSETNSTQYEPFETVPARNDDEVLEVLSHCADQLSDDWIFRGQRLARWDLRSTLERFSLEQKIDAKDAENFFRYEFKRSAHHYLAESHIPKGELEWVALMQHFGAPTRLLDFTHSLWIAAYFALEKATAKCPSAVWAVDMKWCAEKSSELLSNPRGSQSQTMWENRILNPRHLEDCFEDILDKDAEGVVLPAEPFRMNERLVIQQGVFLCAGTVQKRFQENLFLRVDPKESRKHVKKIVIEGDGVRNLVLEYLFKTNINRATLFPGLEGFAQSLEYAPLSWRSRILAQLSAERRIKEMAERSWNERQE